MTQTKLTIVLAAGGTGGHMFPAEATARALLAAGHTPILMTDQRGSAFTATDLEDVAVYRIRAATPSGGGVFKKVKALYELFKGSNDAVQIFKNVQPDAVVGFGGYPSVPAVYAATYRKIPTFIHEQNAVLGRANRLFANKVSAIFGSYDTIEKIPPQFSGDFVKVGSPVRPSFEEKAEAAYPELTETSPINLLITGGSQGAATFARLIPQALAHLPASLQQRISLVQQVPEQVSTEAADNYAQTDLQADLRPFIDNMPEELSKAHFVICRAGASTLAENTIIGRGALYIPYPHAMDDHQTKNVAPLVAAGAALCHAEHNLTPEGLSDILQEAFSHPETLIRMAKQAKLHALPKAATRLVSELEARLASTSLQEISHD